MGMGVKKLNGQGFHVGKQIHTQISERSLADVHHDPVIGKGT